MPNVLPVKLEYSVHELWFDPAGTGAQEGDHVIVQTERGHEIGLAVGDSQSMTNEELTLVIGHAQLKNVLRICSDADLDHAEDLARRGDEALPVFRRYVSASGLEMKPVGVEFLFDEDKAVCYFAAEDRVDFRQLVRDLSRELHVRIDMRQIGVRDETRLLGGYAHCGQELCCKRFGGQFEPVSIRMAKEQDLPLNSSKISGVCGRLMCCLRYEFEAYKDFKSRAPKKKTLIETPLGKAKIQEYDTPKEQLVLRLENGKSFRVNLADMTCTEGCKKRAEEQGCNCRPDCVTRDILERIESPDIALALMELDRENGIDVGDGLSSDDRLISTPAPRRRRGGDSNGSEAGGSSRGGRSQRGRNQGTDAGEEQPQRRRRRRSSGEEAANASRGGQQENASGNGNGSRRRRRHLSSEERDDAFRAAAAREAGSAKDADSGSQGSGNGSRRRRRHSSSSQGASDASERSQNKPNVPSVADQLANSEVKVTRRRPGDGGGSRSEKPAAAGGEASGDAPKRRRRRSRKRSGGEGSGSNSGSANTPSAE